MKTFPYSEALHPRRERSLLLADIDGHRSAITYLCSLSVELVSLLIVPVVATGLETCATSKKDDAANRSRPSGGVTDLALISLLPSLDSQPSTFTSSPTFNTF